MKNSRIAIVIGTRAELIKVFPLMRELKRNKIPYYFIHTGQHSLKDLCDKLEVKNPDIVLTEEPKKSSKFNSNQLKAILWSLILMFKIKSSLKDLKELEYLIYHGDTMSTAIASIASSKIFNPFKKYKSVHLEAGLRSFNNFEPFPEEISRRIAGKFSDILFAVSERGVANLENKRNVIKTGNTIIDSADISLRISKNNKIKSLYKGKFSLITIHRHENLKSRERLSKIVEILLHLRIPSFFAMHDNTKKKLIEFNLYDKLLSNKNIRIIEPLDYPSFIYQMSKCSLVLCDGGSMQEESLIFGKPCIILRKYTERQEGLESNFQFLSKLKIKETKEKIDEFLSPEFKSQEFKNPYGEKGLTRKIVEHLK